jgi:translocation and assembly module TamA
MTFILKTFVFVIFPVLLTAINYSVEFIGLDDAEALKTVKDASSLLTKLQKQSPISINTLHFRSESAIPDIIKALHAHGYYEAKAHIQIKEVGSKVTVLIFLFPGPRYILHSFTITVLENEKLLDCPHLSVESLKIPIDTPIKTLVVLKAEENTLSYLSENGYPLASIIKREMVADYATKTVSIHLEINAGPISTFGPISITGAPNIRKEFLNKKIKIISGELYDSRIIEKTQKALLDTGLFGSVIISHESKQNSQGEIPLHINLTETKHKNINLGITHKTSSGFGLTFGWENRNISNLGRKLSFQGDITQATLTGTGTFIITDAWKINQDYILQLRGLQESMFFYEKTSYSCENRIEKKVNTTYSHSLGITLEDLIVQPHNVHPETCDGLKKTPPRPAATFFLIELPLLCKWSTANDLLNPSQGNTVKYKIIPTMSNPKGYYTYHSLNLMHYYPFRMENSLILAQRLTIESILTSDLNKVPLPKRIFGGSDKDLRGYHYHTVSPLDDEGIPEGGRFGVFYTIEARCRITKSIGITPFLDIGYVENSILPKFNQKWYKSLGVGLCYYTLFGPFCAEIAYPLAPRKNIDLNYRILIRIGQTF